MCTDLGLPLGQRKVMSSEPLAGANWYSFDIVQLENGQSMVRLRRKVDDGPNSIAALVPAFSVPAAGFVPRRPIQRLWHIVTVNGRFDRQHRRAPAAADDIFAANAKSEKYGFNAEISMPRGHVIAGQAELQWLGLFATGAIIVIIGVFSMLLPRRAPGNPVAEIERALAAGEFVPYYQPIVDIRSGQLRGAEVLVRWRKPDGTLVFPGSFIPLAEFERADPRHDPRFDAAGLRRGRCRRSAAARR